MRGLLLELCSRRVISFRASVHRLHEVLLFDRKNSFPIKQKSISSRSAFDVLSKTSPDGVKRTFAIRFRYLLMNAVILQPAFIIRKIPIDNHQFPLKIRQLAVASSNFFSFPLFSLFYRNHPGSDVSHHLSCMQ